MSDINEVSTAAPPALIAIDPQTYVGQVYKPHRDRFTAIAAESALLDYDAATPAGMRVGIERRAALRDVRTDVEKTRAKFKSPLLDAGRLLDQRAKELTAEIKPLEDAHDARIKAVEAAKEAEKAARILAEQQRVAAIHTRIAEIRAAAGLASYCNASGIAEEIAGIEAVLVAVEEFAEFTGLAQLAKDETLAKLADIHAAAVAREVQAAMLKAEQEAAAASLKAAQEELKRQQAAAAERDRAASAERAQADAEAKAAREAAEKEQQAQKAAHEAEMQAERDALQAELAAEREASAKRQAELDRQAKALADAAAKVERDRLDREAAEHARQAAEAKRIADAEAAEAQRVADEQAEVEQAARDAEQAEARRLAEIKAMRRPTDFALAATIASAYRCDHEEAIEWLSGFSANGARLGL